MKIIYNSFFNICTVPIRMIQPNEMYKEIFKAMCFIYIKKLNEIPR